MTTAIQTQKYIEQFRDAFTSGIDSIVESAKIYVEAIEDDPNNKSKFVEAFEDVIPVSAWSGFEAVGRKWMHPKLLLGGGKYASKIKRLPYSDQERIFEGARFDMLTSDGQTLKVDVRNITKEQADQMFNNTHIRTLAEQKAWIESRKAEPEEVVELIPYTISGSKVRFRRNVELTRNELKRILQDM